MARNPSSERPSRPAGAVARAYQAFARNRPPRWLILWARRKLIGGHNLRVSEHPHAIGIAARALAAHGDPSLHGGGFPPVHFFKIGHVCFRNSAMRDGEL